MKFSKRNIFFALAIAIVIGVVQKIIHVPVSKSNQRETVVKMINLHNLFMDAEIDHEVTSVVIEKGGAWITFKDLKQLYYVSEINENYSNPEKYFFHRALHAGGRVIKELNDPHVFYITKSGDTLEYVIKGIKKK